MNHPCGAVGISTVDVIVPKSRFDRFSELYGQILGASPKIIDRRGEARRVYFRIGLSPQGFSPSAISRRPEKEELDQNWLRDHGTGIRAWFFPLQAVKVMGVKCWVPKGLHRRSR